MTVLLALSRLAMYCLLMSGCMQLPKMCPCPSMCLGRGPTKAEQPLLGGSHANEDDHIAAELKAVCAAARQHVLRNGYNCGDSEGLAVSSGAIDTEEDAVDKHQRKPSFACSCSCALPFS